MMEANPSLRKPNDVLEQELLEDAHHEVYINLDNTEADKDSRSKTDS